MRSRILLAIALGAALAVAATQAKEGERKPPISLQDLRDRGVAGHLGVPLGTIATIVGQVVKNDSRNKADSAEPFFLQIEKVDGMKLPQPVKYPFRPQQFAKLPQPKIGEAFQYVAFETGGYDGSPQGEFDFVPAYQTINYDFITSLVILAVKK